MPKMDPVEREMLRTNKLTERFNFEKNRMGGYELIFPCEDYERNKTYEGFVKKANEMWEEFTTGHKGSNQKK